MEVFPKFLEGSLESSLLSFLQELEFFPKFFRRFFRKFFPFPFPTLRNNLTFKGGVTITTYRFTTIQEFYVMYDVEAVSLEEAKEYLEGGYGDCVGQSPKDIVHVFEGAEIRGN